MSWTYRNHTTEGELCDNAPKLPPPNTIYQAFDALRWRRVVGFTERGGYSSFLNPNVNDDCVIIAFAPLTENEAPDENKLRAAWSLGTPYDSRDCPTLLLTDEKETQ